MSFMFYNTWNKYQSIERKKANLKNTMDNFKHRTRLYFLHPDIVEEMEERLREEQEEFDAKMRMERVRKRKILGLEVKVEEVKEEDVPQIE